MINWFSLIKNSILTYIVIVSGSILNVSTVHLNGIWHLIWRYLSKPVLGGPPALSGHYSIPQGCPLDAGFTRGVARIFQRGVTEATHQITIRGSPPIYGLYRCSPSCISGLSRIIAALRPLLTKDKSRWWEYFTKKNKFEKSGLFNNGFYG